MEVDNGVFILVTKECGFDGNWTKAFATLVVADCQGSKLPGKDSHFISKVLAVVMVVGIKEVSEGSIVAGDGIENILLDGGDCVAYKMVEMVGEELLVVVVGVIKAASLLLLSLWFAVLQFLFDLESGQCS